jgi:hypothetical protein
MGISDSAPAVAMDVQSDLPGNELHQLDASQVPDAPLQ